MPPSKVKAIPDGYATATPYLVVRDAAKALNFYAQAFGAEELMRLEGPDGKIAHAEMRIGNSIVMLSEENPGFGARSPLSLGGASTSIMLYLDKVDAAFARAVKAGAQVKQPVADMFWGDRTGRVTDPFGHEWSVATHMEDLTPEQISQRAEDFFAAQSG
ncbi:MAG: VOC family protein [Planctomycetota bacterium]